MVFGSGLDSDDVILTRSGWNYFDLTVSFDGTSGSVYLPGQFDGNNGVETITFGDSVTWDKADMREAYLNQVSTSGNDTIYGFYGTNDTIEAGLGNDSIDGQGGTDTYLYNLGDGNDTIEAGWGSSNADKLIFGSGLNSTDIQIDRSGWNQFDLTLTFDGVSGSIFIPEEFNGNEGIEEITFGDSVVWNIADLKEAYFAQHNTSGNDTIYGFYGANDTIEAGQGNDSIDGQGGTDTYIYNVGDGNDTIEAGWGSGNADKLIFGPGITPNMLNLVRSGWNNYDLTITFDGIPGSIFIPEEFYGNDGIEQFIFDDETVWDQEDIAYYAANPFSDDNYMVGTSGNDTRDGGAGNDTIDGLAGDDSLIGGADNDSLIGGEGNDTLDGGTGDDVLVSTAATGNDLLLGGAGDDDYYFDLASYDGNHTITDSDGDGSITDDSTDLTGTKTEIGMNLWQSGSYYYTISGSDLVVKYNNDNDKTVTVTDFTNGDLGITLNSGIYIGISGADSLTGGSGRDYLWGFAAADTLNGAAGDDHLFGGDDNDLIIGGAGSDYIDGGAGTDTISFAGSSTWVSADLGNNSYWNGDASWDSVTNVENIIGSDYSDYLYGTSGTNVIAGGSGADAIYGYAGTDELSGNAGDDFLYGGDNDDLIIGGAGSDYIDGGNGTDTISFATSSTWVSADLGNNNHWNGDAAWDNVTNVENITGSDYSDYLYGTSGTNVIAGGLGADAIYGYAGADMLYGNAGDDFLYGGDNDDLIIGGAGSDYIDGGNGTDTISFATSSTWVSVDLGNNNHWNGDAAWDNVTNVENITGSDHDDYLYGNSSTNVLTGGLGADALTGGSGADTFKFASLLESTGASYDTIADFVASTDKIDVAGLGFNGLDSGSSPSSGHLGFYTDSGNTFVTDGDDFLIKLTGTVNLTSSDFIFS